MQLERGEMRPSMPDAPNSALVPASILETPMSSTPVFAQQRDFTNPMHKGSKNPKNRKRGKDPSRSGNASRRATSMSPRGEAEEKPSESFRSRRPNASRSGNVSRRPTGMPPPEDPMEGEEMRPSGVLRSRRPNPSRPESHTVSCSARGCTQKGALPRARPATRPRSDMIFAICGGRILN